MESDGTAQNMGVLWEYLEKNGRMVDVYTDRDSMFTVAPRSGESTGEQRQADRLTQLGRALRELGIGSILAYSPQAQVQTGMRRQRLRVELRLDGELKARYQDHYVAIGECGVRPLTAEPKPTKPIRKDHNAGGKSHWMAGFFNRPSPPLWKCLGA